MSWFGSNLENLLVARGLESEWERRLRDLDHAKTELASRQKQRQARWSPNGDATFCAWAPICVSSTPTTTSGHRKEFLCSLLEEVVVVHRDEYRAHLTLRWRGGAFTFHQTQCRHAPGLSRCAPTRRPSHSYAVSPRTIPMPSSPAFSIGKVAPRHTVTASPPTSSAISAVTGRSCFDPPATPQQGELVNVRQAATIRGVASSTIHRWLNDGLIPGEQLTLAAPWRVRVIDELRARFVDEPGEGYVTVQEATRRLGIFRQTVSTAASWGRSTSDVRQKGLRMKMIEDHPGPVPACLMNQRAI